MQDQWPWKVRFKLSRRSKWQGILDECLQEWRFRKLHVSLHADIRWQGSVVAKGREESLNTPELTPDSLLRCRSPGGQSRQRTLRDSPNVYDGDFESSVALNSGDLDKNRVRPNIIFSKDFKVASLKRKIAGGTWHPKGTIIYSTSKLPP